MRKFIGFIIIILILMLPGLALVPEYGIGLAFVYWTLSLVGIALIAGLAYIAIWLIIER